MKTFKKIMALVIAMVMMVAATTAVFADDTGNNTTADGKITIDNAITGQTYQIYKVLDLVSYNNTTESYQYKAVSGWKTFLTQKGFTFDSNDYLTNNPTISDPAQFAKDALAYAGTNNIGYTKTATATSATVEFTGLQLGYYLLDSSAGALCSLDTTSREVIIKEKNTVPTDVKKVEEDSTSTYQDQNDADIDQVINFRTTVHAKKGGSGYVLYDKMETNLDFVSESIAITDSNSKTLASPADYTVAYTGDYKKGGSDGTATNDGTATFVVTFTQTYLDSLTADTDIYVAYQGKLNSSAVVNYGYKNDTTLKYGDDTYTVEDETKSYTWGIKVIKQDDSSTPKKLADAKFVIYKVVSGAVKYAKFSNGVLTGWQDAYDTTTEAELPTKAASYFTEASTILTSDTNGEISVKGLDADEYKLLEIEAPKGYNKLTTAQTATITSNTGTDGDSISNTITATSTNNGVLEITVTNNQGVELPSTGGMGTTIFYVIGAILVLGAGILLVSKRRMSAN